MSATIPWLNLEFEEALRRVQAEFANVEGLLADEGTPPIRLREAFADAAFDVKFLLGLLRFEKAHFDSLVREGRIIGTLAWLESVPIIPSNWGEALASLKADIASIAASPPRFEETIDITELDAPRDMFVSGPDRVTEGEPEQSFDIPEASVVDQVRNEVANLAEKIRARLPIAG